MEKQKKIPNLVERRKLQMASNCEWSSRVVITSNYILRIIHVLTDFKFKRSCPIQSIYFQKKKKANGISTINDK